MHVFSEISCFFLNSTCELQHNFIHFQGEFAVKSYNRFGYIYILLDD